MIAILLFAFLPTSDVAQDRCQVIEKNFVYSGCGKLCLTQFIFWEVRDGQERVRAWRLVKPGQCVERDFQRGGYRMLFHDGERLREVRAPSYRESFSQHDVEISDRENLPPERRRGLRHEKP